MAKPSKVEIARKRRLKKVLKDLIEAEINPITGQPETPSDRYPKGQVEYIRSGAETPSDRYPKGQVEYIRSGARKGTPRAVQRKKGGAVRKKYAKGGAVRGPNS